MRSDDPKTTLNVTGASAPDTPSIHRLINLSLHRFIKLLVGKGTVGTVPFFKSKERFRTPCPHPE